jgi:hypothetical protein
MANAVSLSALQQEAAGLYAVHASGAQPCLTRCRRVCDYFRCNSRPVDLHGLLLLLTPDVVVDYPSGRFVGRDSYLRHQVRVSPPRCI